MRRPLLAAILAATACALAVGGPATAAETYAVLRDWEAGHAALGAPEAVHGVNAFRLGFAMDACPRRVLLDLLYDPSEAGAGAEGIGSVALAFEWEAELWGPEGRIGARVVRASGYGLALGVSADGAHEVRLRLAVGADVAWQARVRGVAVPGEVACLDPVLVTEVESNPAGTDAGAEWVELWNPGLAEIDLSLWTLETTHGVPATLTLPSGTLLAPGARLVVAFADGQALDNEDESVVLRDGLGLVRDQTPTLSDAADDARSWQRAADATWAFATGTPGA